MLFYCFASKRRHTRLPRDWSSDVALPIWSGCFPGGNAMEPEQAAVPTMNRVDVELHQYLSSIRERWLSGLLVAFLVLVVVMGITALQTPRFEATNRIFVQARAGDGVVRSDERR